MYILMDYIIGFPICGFQQRDTAEKVLEYLNTRAYRAWNRDSMQSEMRVRYEGNIYNVDDIIIRHVPWYREDKVGV